MAVKPILFSGPMVRAILDGQKSMTRRVLKPQPVKTESGLWHIVGQGGGAFVDGEEHVGAWAADYSRFAPGDLLWVRETFSGVHEYEREKWPPSAWFTGDPLWYWADGNPTVGDWTKPKPGIHMPRWASRLTLEVTAVKVERLQDISEDDAFAEGVETDAWDMAPVAKRYGTEGWFVGWPTGVSEPCISVDDGEVCRRSFASLWNSINGAGAWEANPWVAAVSFTVHRANVDALPAKAA